MSTVTSIKLCKEKMTPAGWKLFCIHSKANKDFPFDPAATADDETVLLTRLEQRQYGYDQPVATKPEDKPAVVDNWVPFYSRWRHGGWYVDNVRYPDGSCGCVSRNFDDKRWRIVCDSRRTDIGKPGDFTYPNRDAAARAERDLVASLAPPAILAKSTETPQFIMESHWEHIFPGEKLRTIRFCLDVKALEANKGVAAFTSLGVLDSKGWRMAFRTEGEDVLDSLINGNPDFLDHPELYGAVRADSIPDWDNEIRGRSLM